MLQIIHRALPRARHLALLVLAGALSPSQAVHAQPAPTMQAGVLPGTDDADQDVPWLYKGSQIPVDESWTFGELDNGLRYAVKDNAAPPGQIAIRIAVDVGSLYERESERGYAHLLEHALFRESRYVPEGEAKRIWQRFGATFGSDTNAQTSTTQTLFQLDLPDATMEKLDESMQILSGMIADPIFRKSGLEADKAIVLAEKREREGPFSELVTEANRLFYHGQRIASRPIIGTEETVRAATPKSVRAFHDRWYRPDNVVISIAGDAPPALLEEMIKQHFGDWRVEADPAPVPDFGDPVPGGPKVKLLVEPNTPPLLYWTITRPWRAVRDTFAYNEQNIADYLALAIINRRLEARARKSSSFLSAFVRQDKVSRSADITQMQISPAGDDWRAALAEARAFVADAIETPPSQADIDREVRIYMNELKVSAEGYSSEPAAQAAESIPLAVDIRETVATPMVVMQFVKGAIPRFTPERLHESTKRLFDGDTSRLLMISPKPIEGGEEALADAFAAPVDSAAAERVDQREIGFDALPDLGEPGTVVARDSYSGGQVEVTFANGVKAFMRPRTAQPESVQILVRFGRGYQSFAPDEPNALWSGAMGLIAAGVGDLGLDELEQLAAGRQLALNFGIDYDAFELSAETRPSELAGQLKLMAAKLEKPRWDTGPLVRAQREFVNQYPLSRSSPDAVMSRDLEGLLSGGDKRFAAPTPAQVTALTGEQFRRFWEPLLKDGPVEIVLVGDFQVDAAIDALSRSFGAIAPRPATPPAEGGREVAFAENGGKAPVTRYHDGNADLAAAFIAWPGGAGMTDLREQRELEVLGQIFWDRLIEEFRELDQASYSPQAYSFWPENMDSGGYVAAYSLVAPSAVPLFFERAEAVAADLVAKPVSEDELTRAVVPQEQIVLRSSTANLFWIDQLEGVTRDLDARQRAIVSLVEDYGTLTPADIQAAAKKYLRPDAAWRMRVLPRAAAAQDGAQNAPESAR